MCAAFELNSRVLRPGKLVRVWRAQQPAVFLWAGFARRESLGWWREKGADLVDIPADRFAERSDHDRQLRWDAVPPGLVIRGLVDPHEGQPLLKVVTRASTAGEAARFHHDRMPLLESALFSAEPPGLEDAADAAQQEFWSTAAPHKLGKRGGDFDAGGITEISRG